MNKNIFRFIIVAIFIISIVGCTSQQKQPEKIKITTSTWVGYAPLLYAYENGELDKLNIELVVTNSLQSSVLMYEKNNYDGICSTQKELQHLNQKQKDDLQKLIPIAIFNRSYGGDVILSNISKEELYDKDYKVIDIFMETNSVNEILFEGFKNLKNWKSKFNIHNINQYNIANLKCDLKKDNPTIIITYEPYATKLKQKGYKLIESTKNDKLLIFDFLNIKNGILNKKEIEQLQIIINRSIEKLIQDPKHFYHDIQSYYQDISYEEFNSSLEEIQLFSKKRKEKMIRLIKTQKVSADTIYIKGQ